MRKNVSVILVLLSFIMLTSCGGVQQSEYDQVVSELQAKGEELEQVQNEFDSLENDYLALQREYNVLQSERDSAARDYAELKEEYDSYKERMQPYEELSKEEAEARKIAAEKEIEAAAVEAEAAAAAEAEEKEQKEKQGYDTGITYDQLARTPDDYEGELVKFKGEVIQVIEGDDEIQIRLAVNGDYDRVIYCGYEPAIVSSRVLENDKISIYGTSVGLISYESTLGGQITIPAVWVDRIDQ
ncbi:MAG: hypothetical protein IJ792_01150 [Oscillospiraceae bacterium]|nr:hypothetical protein [Oscillospiraceae bacterium]